MQTVEIDLEAISERYFAAWAASDPDAIVALISGDSRFDCLDVVEVGQDGLVTRKDTFIDTAQLEAAMGGAHS